MYTCLPSWSFPLVGALSALLSGSQAAPPSDPTAAIAPQVRPRAEEHWRTSVGSEIRRVEYEFSALGLGAWTAPNRARGLRSRISSAGLEVFPRETDASAEGAAWRLRLETVAFGRVDDPHPLECRAVRAEGQRVELQFGPLVEWFVNDERGLEQGWTIASRPPGTAPLVIQVRVSGDLSLCVADGGRWAEFVDATGEPRARYAELIAWDATGARLRVRMLPTPAGLELRVGDAQALYPVTVDPLMTRASWTAESTKSFSEFGTSVSTAGDVNGDGYADVIVGAPFYDNGKPAQGRAFVYYGSATGLGTTAAWAEGVQQFGANFGWAVSSAGDVNGDGFDDVIVGAKRFDAGETDEGRAFVYHGSSTGLETSKAWVAESNKAGSHFGFFVAGSGDVNGDGYDDVLVGAPFYQVSFAEGRVYAYYGSATGLSQLASWSAATTNKGAEFGFSGSSAGDVNADGYNDVIIGAPGFDDGEPEAGRAFVYHGSAAGLGAGPAWVSDWHTKGSNYGRAVSGAGDVNADGYDDVIIGVPTYTNGELIEGRAYVYHGSAAGLDLAASWIAESNQIMAVFGQAVSGAGDVNGDGYDDVIVGALGYDNDEFSEGRAYVFHGAPGGLEETESWTAEGNQALAFFGTSVSTAGDVNGDGYDDVIVGAPGFDVTLPQEGRAFVFHGSPPPVVSVYCTAGTSSSGCVAQISSSGAPSASAPSGFVLSAATVEGSKHGLFFFGTNGRQANPWGNGTSFQCVAPPVTRAGNLAGSGTHGQCDGAFSRDLNSLWCPACPSPGTNPGAGAVVQAQLWYRDPQSTSNQTTSLSNALEFTVAP